MFRSWLGRVWNEAHEISGDFAQCGGQSSRAGQCNEQPARQASLRVVDAAPDRSVDRAALRHDVESADAGKGDEPAGLHAAASAASSLQAGCCPCPKVARQRSSRPAHQGQGTRRRCHVRRRSQHAQ